LYAEAEWHTDKGHVTKTAIFKIQDGRRTAFCKIVKSPHLSEKSSDFDEIWYAASDIEPDDSHMTKI